MKCVAVRKCQSIRDDGKIVFYMKGDIEEFKKCPAHFRPIEGKDAPRIDFATAGEAELLEAEYELADLKKFIEDRYDMKPGNRGLEKTVAFLLDCRFRDLGDMDLNKVL